MSSINSLNYKFLQFKIMYKYKFVEHIVNIIRLTQSLTYVVRV